MASPVISGDGVFSHVFLGAKDLAASTKFYDAALGALGIKNMGPFGETIFLYGKDKPAFLVGKPGSATTGVVPSTLETSRDCVQRP